MNLLQIHQAQWHSWANAAFLGVDFIVLFLSRSHGEVCVCNHLTSARQHLKYAEWLEHFGANNGWRSHLCTFLQALLSSVFFWLSPCVYILLHVGSGVDWLRGRSHIYTFQSLGTVRFSFFKRKQLILLFSKDTLKWAFMMMISVSNKWSSITFFSIDNNQKCFLSSILEWFLKIMWHWKLF